jgi:hypothetical protein
MNYGQASHVSSPSHHEPVPGPAKFENYSSYSNYNPAPMPETNYGHYNPSNPEQVYGSQIYTSQVIEESSKRHPTFGSANSYQNSSSFSSNGLGTNQPSYPSYTGPTGPQTTNDMIFNQMGKMNWNTYGTTIASPPMAPTNYAHTSYGIQDTTSHYQGPLASIGGLSAHYNGTSTYAQGYPSYNFNPPANQASVETHAKYSEPPVMENSSRFGSSSHYVPLFL